METLKGIFSSRLAAWLLVLISAIAVPPLMGEYMVSMLILVCIWAIMCFSLNVIYGYTGQLSLGQAAFFGIGAYAFGILTVKLHMGFWPSFFTSLLITGLSGFLIGIPALKLKGPYFILVTLGFSVIIGVILVAWVDLTGGANGLAGIPKPTPVPLPWGGQLAFDSLLSMYYFILFFLIIIMLFSHRLVHSLIGKTFIAISYNENLTESLGINTMSAKLLSFTISAVMAGVAGVLYGSYNVVISPEIAYFARGMDVVAYLIVGGAGTMAGPILGTLVLMAVPELLQVLPSLKTLINGVILMLFIIFLPSGITGGAKAVIGRLIKSRTESYGPARG
ncbi:MAG TPA: branched-chain amino acid ABC transporter permease [Desulfatiglandales bacterium]|nr:branched-chain amino acid ABC transporter permease [Desulfatiglandales bacterium]